MTAQIIPMPTRGTTPAGEQPHSLRLTTDGFGCTCGDQYDAATVMDQWNAHVLELAAAAVGLTATITTTPGGATR